MEVLSLRLWRRQGRRLWKMSRAGGGYGGNFGLLPQETVGKMNEKIDEQYIDVGKTQTDENLSFHPFI